MRADPAIRLPHLFLHPFEGIHARRVFWPGWLVCVTMFPFSIIAYVGRHCMDGVLVLLDAFGRRFGMHPGPEYMQGWKYISFVLASLMAHDLESF